MALEIERKFRVKSDAYKADSFDALDITQGYLSSIHGRTVRARLKGEKGYITIKGKSSESGMTRFEWEKEIPAEEARELLKLCESEVIRKTRFHVKCGMHTFEVDEFYGDNQGLTIAEVELGSEAEVFEKPPWLGEEVTGDYRYYNSRLLKNPYKNW